MLLRWIRPRWLRAIVRVLLNVVAEIVAVAAVLVVGGVVIESVPFFSGWSPQQQSNVIVVVLGACAIVLVMWSLYYRLKRARANAWFHQGLLDSREGRFEDALADYEHAIAIASKFPHAWMNKGVSLIRLGRYEEALPAVNHALTLDPTDSLAWNNKADLLCEYLNRYEEAVAVCDAARKKHIETPGLYAIRADALHALGRDIEARTAYERVLKLRARDFLGWAARAQALAGVGRYQEALATFDKALALDADYPHPRLWREKALALRALGRDDEALDAEAQADALDG